jgi:glycosyltransferase involved in cell wall biosynthesis
MKFLFIDFNLPYLLRDASYPVGGWAVELHAWIRGLRANGHDVGVLTWKGANRFVDRKTDFDLIEAYDPARGLRVLKYFYDYLPALKKCSASYGPDVIVQACAELYTGIMAYVAGGLGIPFIYRVANDMDTDGRYRRTMPKYAQLAYRYGLKNADAVLCQNQYQYENISRRFPGKTTEIIHNPFFKSVDASGASDEDRTYIAWLGVFKTQKNLPLLYEIARQMPDREFKVAGMPGRKMDNTITNALADLEKLPNVAFVGYLSRDRVFPFLSRARVLLNTSHFEGFSNVFLEAFSVGTPVVAPEHADPDHIIRKNGLGLTTADTAGFPQCVNGLFEDEALFKNASGKCRRYVKEHHDPVTLARHMADMVRRVKDSRQ